MFQNFSSCSKGFGALQTGEKGDSMPTKEQLQKRVRELEEENDELQDQLDQIFDIVAPEGEDAGDGEEAKDGDSGKD